MKNMTLKSIVSLGMTALAMLAFLPERASAQQTVPNSPQGSPERLEGVWDSHVILTDCHGHTVADFRAFEMFHRGGTLTSVDNTPPTQHGPGLGTWQYLGHQNYSAPFQFFNFNPDGSFAGIQKIERNIVLDAHAESYTSVVTFEAIDPNGNVLFSGCGTESATRLD
jgi:hypothetical protein